MSSSANTFGAREGIIIGTVRCLKGEGPVAWDNEKMAIVSGR